MATAREHQRSVRPTRTSRFTAAWSVDAPRRAGLANWVFQLALLPKCVVAAAVALVLRFGRSRGTERPMAAGIG